MPELPEVEANARNLARWIEGRRIVAVTPPPGTRETGGQSGAAFARVLAGRRVEQVTRRGKWMLLRLDGGAGLALHLGMTGKLARAVGDRPPPRFTRAIFELDDGTRVCFVDSRRFGKLLAAPRYDELVARRDLAKIGPDALSELDGDHLRRVLAATGRSVKEAIMDQDRVAGVGNLYATEALWSARIHPGTPAPRIAEDPHAVEALLDGIRGALRHGLRVHAGTELPEYVEEGGPNPFFAYDRKGEPCPRCGTRFEAVPLGGRTSAFCPTCQPQWGARARRGSSKPRRGSATTGAGATTTRRAAAQGAPRAGSTGRPAAARSRPTSAPRGTPAGGRDGGAEGRPASTRKPGGSRLTRRGPDR